jgi:hypothetical protein
LKDASHAKLDHAHHNELRWCCSHFFFLLGTEVVRLIAYPPLHLDVLKKRTQVGSSGSCQPVIISREMSSYISYRKTYTMRSIDIILAAPQGIICCSSSHNI